MGSPLVVELAEIRVADVENTALTTYKDPPNTLKSQAHQGLPFGTYSPKQRPHLLLNSLPTSFMKFLVMTALQWTDEPTLNQKDQRT